MIIQICAMRCFLEIGEELKNASEEQRRMVVDKFPGFLNFITDFATRANGNILSELLSTIATVIGVSILALRRPGYILTHFSNISDSSSMSTSHQPIILV